MDACCDSYDYDRWLKLGRISLFKSVRTGKTFPSVKDTHICGFVLSLQYPGLTIPPLPAKNTESQSALRKGGHAETHVPGLHEGVFSTQVWSQISRAVSKGTTAQPDAEEGDIRRLLGELASRCANVCVLFPLLAVSHEGSDVEIPPSLCSLCAPYAGCVIFSRCWP